MDPYFGKINEQVTVELTPLAVAQSASITVKITVTELTKQEYEISSRGQVTNDLKMSQVQGALGKTATIVGGETFAEIVTISQTKLPI